MGKKIFNYLDNDVKIIRKCLESLKNYNQGLKNPVNDFKEISKIKNDLYKINMSISDALNMHIDDAVKVINEKVCKKLGVEYNPPPDEVMKNYIIDKHTTKDKNNIKFSDDILKEIDNLIENINQEDKVELDNLLSQSDEILKKYGSDREIFREIFHSEEYNVNISRSGKSFKFKWSTTGNNLHIVIPTDFNINMDDTLLLDLYMKKFGSEKIQTSHMTDEERKEINKQVLSTTKKKSSGKGKKKKSKTMSEEDLSPEDIEKLFLKHRNYLKVVNVVQRKLNMDSFKETGKIITRKLSELNPTPERLQELGFSTSSKKYKEILRNND